MTKTALIVALALCLGAPLSADERLQTLDRVRLLEEAGDLAAAAKPLAAWVKAHPDDSEAALWLGQLYSNSGQERRALKTWERLLERRPDPALYSAVSDRLKAVGRRAAAIRLLEQGRKRLRDGRLFGLELAELYRLETRFDAAVAAYLEYLGQQPQRLGLIQHHLRPSARDPQHGPALIAALEAAYRDTPSIHAAGLLSSMALDAGLPERGYAALEAGIDDPEIAQMLFSFAGQCERGGHPATAARAFALFARTQKDSPFRYQAWLRQAQMQTRLRRHDAAAATYRQLAEAFPQRPEAAEALLGLAQLQLDREHNPEGARQTLDGILQSRPRGQWADRARLLLAETALREGDLDEAAGHLEYVSGHTAEAEARFRQAELAYFAADFAAARQTLEAFCRQSPQDDRANDALDLLLVLEEFVDEEQALKDFAAAQLHERRGDLAAADRAWARLEESGPDALRQLGLYRRARAREATDAAAALQLYGRLAADKDNIYALEGLLGQARLFESRGDGHQALRTYESALLQYPTHAKAPTIRLHIQRLRPLYRDGTSG